MRGVSKKMLISILTSVIVFVTMVATTFAWVGIFTYANTENFSLNLKTQDLDVNYFLTISATGKKGTFSDEADLIDIERKILENQNKWSKSYISSLNNDAIEKMYKANSVTTPSTTQLNGTTLGQFKSVDMKTTDHFTYYDAPVPYLKFDIYLSVDTKEGLQDTSYINANVYLTQLASTLEGTINDYKVLNKNPFGNMPSANEILKTIPDFSTFKVNSKNACRFALCLYNPISINDSYTDETPIKTVIYQGGTQNPSIDGDVYNLGGNLPEDSNTALKELLVIRPDYKYNNNITYSSAYEEALLEAVNRGNDDLELVEANSKLWNKPLLPKAEKIDDDKYSYNYLGIKDGLQTKMKIEVVFWFEGWDSDCLMGIDQKPVSLNLTFTAGTED